ncbi:hypothetical protein [Phenylobacterium sp.]|uniref:hypothetical protein n=1 Tax=Phenylobacterium sp. TaxID=1871053 RepID=UPI0025F8F293|nr:hypothetical protein [Phenylobacterium sp.]
MNEIARQALRQAKILELRYDGFSRDLDVHACGYTKQGHAVLRGWQASGGSASGEREGRKLMRLDEASAAHVSDRPSQAPRKGFKKGDPAMARIVCEVSPRW